MERNRQVLLVKRPRGIPASTDFAIVESAMPSPAVGQFVVRTRYLSVDPAQRGWASDEANYSAPLTLGSVMRALAVGEVVASADDEVAEGALLYGWFGWQDYALADRTDIIRRIGPSTLPLSAALGVVGLNGITAYLAVDELARAREGETILVSTAAGGVGSVVGQLARLRGLETIGLTSGADKVALCGASFGYDHAIDYRAASDLTTAIAAAAPSGIDIFFDNTGGWIADAVMPLMNVRGRVIQCGTAAIASWIPVPEGPRRERLVLTKRLSWTGFVAFDHIARFDDAARHLEDLAVAGKLAYREEMLDGIAEAPGAIARLYDGSNLGRIVIRP